MKDNKHQSPRLYSYKGTEFEAQFKATYAAFYHGTKTMYEVAIELGISRANICRYVGNLRHSGRIYRIGKRICQVSRCSVIVYTTDMDKMPEDDQLRLIL